MSRVIKSDQLIMSAPIELELLKGEPEKSKSNVNSDDPTVLIEETEEIVRDLLLKAKLRAEVLINNANINSEQILAESIKEAEQIREKAFNEGFNNGYADAQKDLEVNKEKILAEAAKVLEEAVEKKKKYLAEVKEEIVELSTTIASKLICQQIELQPGVVQQIVNDVIAKANPEDQSFIFIQVAPEDHQKIILAIENQQISWPNEQLKVNKNADLTSGSCIITTSFGTYQLVIDEALDKIKELLLGAEIYE